MRKSGCKRLATRRADRASYSIVLNGARNRATLARRGQLRTAERVCRLVQSHVELCSDRGIDAQISLGPVPAASDVRGSGAIAAGGRDQKSAEERAEPKFPSKSDGSESFEHYFLTTKGNFALMVSTGRVLMALLRKVFAKLWAELPMGRHRCIDLARHHRVSLHTIAIGRNSEAECLTAGVGGSGLELLPCNCSGDRAGRTVRRGFDAGYGQSSCLLAKKHVIIDAGAFPRDWSLSPKPVATHVSGSAGAAARGQDCAHHGTEHQSLQKAKTRHGIPSRK